MYFQSLSGFKVPPSFEALASKLMSINFTVSYDGLVKAKSAPPPLSVNKVRTVLHFTFMFSWMYPKVYRVYWVGSTMILVIPLMGIWQNRLVNRPGG